MLLVLLLSLTISQAFGEITSSLNLEGLRIEVEAPDEAKINEEFDIKLIIHPYEEIDIDHLTITFGPLNTPIYEETLVSYPLFTNVEIPKTFRLKVNSYGRIPCTIKIHYARWVDTSWLKGYEKEIHLDLTYVTNETREELESENGYLKNEVKDLQEKVATGNVFFLTTIIFSASTFIFLGSTIYLILKIRRKEQSKSTEKKEEGPIKR